MNNSPAVIASRNFLATVWDGDPPTFSALIEVLDRLLVSYHDTLSVEAPFHELEPPDRDWKKVYDQACKRFPKLGLYPIADPSEPYSDSLMMGDAIDDIADITSDLRNTVWYADNHSDQYANAYFKNFYFHWGQHSRALLLFLSVSQAD